MATLRGEKTMPLRAGEKLGNYEILSAIGAGGMGEVYRARDTKLGREVAIKVLPEELSQDPERLARFEREAKLLASLNHPAIATLHGFEDGFLVMELVEGETLGQRIATGVVPFDEALPLFVQIAEGLEAAHEKGIIHRDLKPANIKITPEGKVKILDFGLAKAFARPEAEVDDSSQSPTLTKGTALGAIMGTASYMSPEQARGKPVDKRTDIWAFGCCLYETLTRKKAFEGDTVTDTISSVVQAQPNWAALPARLHPRLREILKRCLEKEARRRYHDIADVRIDIEKIQREPDYESVGTRHRKLAGIPAWSVTGFALGAILAGATVWNLIPMATNAPRPVRFSFSVPTTSSQQRMGGVLGRLAISPDRTGVAYVGASRGGLERTSGASDRQLYLRPTGESDARSIPGTEGAQNPFFSPDGAWVGFVAQGKLQRVALAGGAPIEICKAWQAHGASWGPNDSIIFGGGIGIGLMRVAATGGRPESLTFPDAAQDEVAHGFPEILPDGRTVLFTIGAGDGSRLAKLSLDTGEWEELLPHGAGPRYLSAGYLMFSENGNLRLSRFDLRAGQMIGSVLPALDGIERESWAGLEDASFAVSRNGDLAFIRGGLGSFETRLVWVDRRGEETFIDADRAEYIGPRISPDGRRIAINRLGELGFGEVWVMDVDGSQAFPVANDGADYNPVWTQDGTTLTYTSNGNLFEKVVDRDDPRVPFLTRDNYQFSRSWSPDGRFLAIMEFSVTGSRIWMMPRGGEPEPLLDSSFNSGSPIFAPVGDLVAYVSDESGQDEVYVRSYPGLERGRQVSKGGGWGPVWSVDGQELFYRHGTRMMSVAIRTEPELNAGEPAELWDAPYFDQGLLGGNSDVASDGRFLMLKMPETSDAEPTTIHVFLDWLSQIEERMQAGAPAQ